MGTEKTLSEWERKLEKSWRSRKRLRNILVAGLVILLFLLLWPWSCESDKEHTPVSPSRSVSVPPSPRVGGPRAYFVRPSLERTKGTAVPWGRLLSERLKNLGQVVQPCFREAEHVEWNFLFNPSNGHIRHQKFSSGQDKDLRVEIEDCLIPLLPKAVDWSGDYPPTWFPVTLNLVSPGHPVEEGFSIPIQAEDN